jgi:molecular chaperone DnaK
MGRIIGIDLGTTYSCISVFDERKGTFVVMPGTGGTPTTPSVVGCNKDGSISVGASAKAKAAAEPQNTIAEIKRHMGEPLKDASGAPKLGLDGKPMPYKVTFANKEHTPQMISAYILRDLKAAAEKYLNEPVTGAVITVPAYFEGGPRRATEEAGTMAGLNVQCLLSEPTAAAIAFGMTTKKGDEEEASTRRVLVYDLGGGTFDVSVIEITAGNIEVKGVGGDHYLGGVDFDRAIVEWVLKKIKAEHDVDLQRTDGLSPDIAKSFTQGYARICAEAEKAKIALSTQASTVLTFPFLFMHPQHREMLNIEYEITTNEFLTMIMGKLKGTIATVDKVLADVSLSKNQIDDVLLVGGSTRIPKIREMLEKHFGKPPRTDINPDECVAVGAAMQALRYVDTGALTKEAEQKVEEQLGNMGQVIDVTGHSLGLREGHDNMDVLIPKNTPIPAAAEKTYQTADDYQTQVKVRVYQGEDSVASRNTLLTEFDVMGLPPLPQGQVKMKIRYSLDVSGVLHVEATELVKNTQVKVEAKYGGATTVDPSMLAPAKTVAPVGRNNMGGGGGASGPEIPASMQEAWKKAQGLMSTLPADNKAKLDGAMKNYLTALQSGDSSAIANRGNELIDTLFDVE